MINLIQVIATSLALAAPITIDGPSYCKGVTNTGVCNQMAAMHCFLLTEHNNFSPEGLGLCTKIAGGKNANCADDLACMTAVMNKNYSGEEITACDALDGAEMIACLEKSGK